jgi:hypothetical protein
LATLIGSLIFIGCAWIKIKNCFSLDI